MKFQHSVRQCLKYLFMNYHQTLTIKSLAEEDRPREKMILKGRSALSDSELMAILIGSGSKNESAVMLAQRILAKAENQLDKLGHFTLEDLKRFKGIGEAKAVTLLAALELGRRRQTTSSDNRILIKSSGDAYNVLKPHLSDLRVEEFWVVHLNRANKVISKQRISSGGMTGTVVDTRIVFKDALDHAATCIILCHNHPSGQLKPSQADIDLTKKLSQAGKLMDIQVVDHLIIGQSDYFSFADEGLM